jgi:glycosyltransferase involved in cell wall biosynthesis
MRVLVYSYVMRRDLATHSFLPVNKRVDLRRLMFGLKTGVLRVIAPRAGIALPALDNIIVAGLFKSPTGLGESARLCFKALTYVGYKPAAVDLCEQLRIGGGVVFDYGALSPMPGPGILILHINGPQVSRAIWHIGRALVRDKLIVGYWAWELEGVPSEWSEEARFVHEIWAPSRFAAGALARAIDRVVRVVPHVLPLPSRKSNQPDRQALARAALGLPGSAFVVAFGFAMRSSFERKNPLAAIAAFKLAFGHDPEAMLILRCLDLDAYPAGAARLCGANAGWSNIRLLTGLSHPMSALIDAADVYLSLHRSEGFGLTLLEAMAAGKPVVATDWSGNTDFMSMNDSLLVESSFVAVDDPQGIYRRGEDRWAAPSIRAAATALRRLRRDSELRTALGARATGAAERFALRSRTTLLSAVHDCTGVNAHSGKPEALSLRGLPQ